MRRAKNLIRLVRRVARAARNRTLFPQFLENPDDHFGPAVASESRAGNEWDQYCNEVTNELEENPMTFLRGPVISRTVHPDQQILAERYLEDLSRSDFARKQILARLCDPPMGNPYLCEAFPVASPMSVQHGFYLNLLRENLDLYIPGSTLSCICEFGGGYGNFCRLAYTMGYEGDYCITDLPVMRAMQKQYLQHTIPADTLSQSVTFSDEICGPGSTTTEETLFMATFSLSETSMEVREKVEEQLIHYQYLFFAYNQSFGGIDNEEYFRELVSRHSERFEFKTKEDPHRRAWFLFGKRKTVA